jgi:hypothetical protein
MYDITFAILCTFHIDFFSGNVFGSVSGNVLRNRVLIANTALLSFFWHGRVVKNDKIRVFPQANQFT